MTTELFHPYSPDPIAPCARVGDNLTVWSDNREKYYKVEYQEGIPPSSQTLIDMGAVPAGGTLAAAILANLQLDDNHFLHLRWQPLDDVEGVLYLKSGQPKFRVKTVAARVTAYSVFYDPNLATTTFFILGRDKDPFLEVRNPNPANARARSRFLFWGYKYILVPLPTKPDVSIFVPAEARM